MERLTKTYSNGTHGASDSLPCGENSYDYKNLLIERLGKYEDLEEQGRLIKLSCTTKDTVWHFCRELGQILEYKVYEVTIYSETPIYHCVAYSEGFPKDTLDEISVRTSEFGKSVFLTKSEAEARLKEPNYIEEVISQCPSSDLNS